MINVIKNVLGHCIFVNTHMSKKVQRLLAPKIKTKLILSSV